MGLALTHPLVFSKGLPAQRMLLIALIGSAPACLGDSGLDLGGGAGGAGGSASGGGGNTGTGGFMQGGAGGAVQCGPICDIYCPYGNVVDSRGCATCKCNPVPVDCNCGPQPVAPPIACAD